MEREGGQEGGVSVGAKNDHTEEEEEEKERNTSQ